MELKPKLSGDWGTKRLGDYVTFLRNGVNSRAELLPEGRVKYLHYGDVHACKNVYLSTASLPCLPDAKAGLLDRLQDGDVIFADASEDVAGVSKSVEMRDVGSTEVVSGLHTIAARFDKEVLVDGFKGFLQFCPPFVTHLRRLAAGTKVYATNRAHIASVEMLLPGVREQRAIAVALSDVDALLDGLDRLIAKKRDLKQATMQQLLTGQTRLPGLHGEWEIKQVVEIGTTYGGLTGKTKADFGVGHARYVTFLNVLENVIIDPHKCEPVCVEPGERQNMVLRGDILFNGTSETPDDLAMAAVTQIDEDNLFLNSFCFGFRVHDSSEHLPLFLAYYFRGSPGRQIMYALAQGATRYNMSKSQFKALALLLPPHDEQKAIATVFCDMDAEIAALEARRDKTLDLKQAMMQELLTGKTRLVQPEVAHA